MDLKDQDVFGGKDTENEAGIFGNMDDIDGEFLLEGKQDDEDGANRSHCSYCLEECKTLRVLSCLHICCEQCIEGLVETERRSEPETEPFSFNQTSLRGLLCCPTCKQETLLGKRGLTSLPLDPVAQNKVSLEEKLPIQCTACKNSAKADAKCLDCDNFLCSKCYGFHQYMRCFENHKVRSIEAFTEQGDTLQQFPNPLCSEHSNEELRFYCNTCRMAACTQCRASFHVGSSHLTERMRDAVARCREELQSLCDQTNSRQSICRQTARKLETMFGDLQTQSDAARDAVEAAYQDYVAQVAKARDEMFAELKNLHASLELKLMDASNRVEHIRSRINHAVDYTCKLLDLKNPVDVLSLREHVKSQLLLLLSSPVSCEDLNMAIKFENDQRLFAETMKTLYGRITTGNRVTSPGILTPSPTPHPRTPSQTSFPLMNLPSGINRPLPPNISPQNPQTPIGRQHSPSSVTLIGRQHSEGSVTLIGRQHSEGSVTPIQERNIKQLAALFHQQLVQGATSMENQPKAKNLNPSLAGNGENNVGLTGQSLINLQALAMLNLKSTPQNEHGLSLPVRSGMNSGTQLNWASVSNVPSQSPLSPVSPFFPVPFESRPLGSLPKMAFPPPQTMAALKFPASMQPSKFHPMQIRIKFGQLGFDHGQFNSPHGFCLGPDEDILVADTNNHRIQVFDQTGDFKFQFGDPGKEDGQLWFPRKLAVLRGSGSIVVCDRGNARSRIQQFSATGLYLTRFSVSFIDIVAAIAVNHRNNVIVVDSVNPSVYELNTNGDLQTWFDCSSIVREPSDIAVFNEKYFICDFKANCVAVFDDTGKCLKRIGDESIIPFPNGIDVSATGEIVVGTSHGNRFRVNVFDSSGQLIGQYECPHIKVSRCCGLKITVDGYIITLAKNSHHVLVFNTLYVM